MSSFNDVETKEESKQQQQPEIRQWNDVTDIVQHITDGMALGEMIHGNNFNLHSAMSALEIGDGVLDAAMKHRLLYIENVVRDDKLLTQLFNVERTDCVFLATLDELIRLLWSFMCGNNDQLSMYSCLYLHEGVRGHLKSKQAPNLYLFIDGVKLCCAYVREMVTYSNSFEDDDWAKSRTHVFADFNDLNSVDKLIADMQAKVALLKSGKSVRDLKLLESSFWGMGDGDGDDAVRRQKYAEYTASYTKAEYMLAISFRFEFVLGLLEIVREMHSAALLCRMPKKEAAAPSSSSSSNAAKKHASKKSGGGGGGKANKSKRGGKSAPVAKQDTNPNPNDDTYLIDRTARSKCGLSSSENVSHKLKVANLKGSASVLLRVVNQMCDTQTMGVSSEELSPAFDDRVANTKAVHAPRRQRIASKQECARSLQHWCKNLRFVSSITKLGTFDDFLSFLDALSHLEQFPNVFLRAFVLILFEGFVKHDTFLWSRKPMTHFIQSSCQQLCEWARIMPHTKAQYLGDYVTFFSRIETGIRDAIRQRFQHITRQLDWSKRVLRNWAILQSESPEIDRLTALSYLHGFEEKYRATVNQMDEHRPHFAPFTSWIMDKACDSMIAHMRVHLAPSMQLYACYELEYVYFYLEHLFSQKCVVYRNAYRRFRSATSETIKGLMNPQYREIRERRRKKLRGKNSSSSSSTYNDVDGAKLPEIDPMERYAYLLSEAQRSLCLAIFELIQVFYHIRKQFKRTRLACTLEWNGLTQRSDDDDDDENDDDENDSKNNDSGKDEFACTKLGHESLRFAHRFHVFGVMEQPSFADYQQFRNMRYEYDQQCPSLSDKLKSCESQFDQSRKCFALLSNHQKLKTFLSFQEEFVRNASKVAIKNKIFVAMLHKHVSHVLQEKINDNDNDQKTIERIVITHQYSIHQFYPVFEKVDK